MTEETTVETSETETEDTPTPRTFSQDEVNSIVSDRLARDRQARVDESATRIAELEQENTALTTAKAELEANLTESRLDVDRLTTGLTHGITNVEEINLFLTGADNETLTKQAQALAAKQAAPAESSAPLGVSLQQGDTTPVQSDDKKARAFFGL